MKEKRNLMLTGILLGAVSVALVFLGNPKNMGFCIACFLRDTAGGLGLHGASAVQYIRPEVIGLVLGAFLLALCNKEFSPRGGSSPMTRFVLGFIVMVGALVFLGCPFRMILRIAGGDLNAVIGLVGFSVGIGMGTIFLKRGYSLKRTYSLPVIEGIWLPVIQIALFGLLCAAPAYIYFSEKGAGSMHAPVWASLLAGVIVGAVAQRTRLCMVGGIRDLVLFRDWTLLSGFVAIFATALIGNIALGYFKLGFAGQPIAHTDGLWNLLSMVTVGFGCVLLGGCPMRQLVLAGEGNSDSAVTVIGLLSGAAFAHNFGWASAATVVAQDGTVTGGPTIGGKIAVIVGLLILIVIAVSNSKPSAQGGNNR